METDFSPDCNTNKLFFQCPVIELAFSPFTPLQRPLPSKSLQSRFNFSEGPILQYIALYGIDLRSNGG